MNDDLMTQEELDALLREHSGENSLDEPDINDFLTPLEQDALAEIGNISMGSATALSTLVNRKVSITVPRCI